ncbi:MAG: glycosyl hydrolase [Anaerolineae bacterium]
MPNESDFKGLLEWRCIGPFRGGRVVAVAGDYQNPTVFYFGGVAGGIWKTTDGGQYWECVSDGFLKTSSVGALAVAPSDSNVIYAGMGETTIRIDVSHGDGVYKSTDAGKTWRHMGLADTRHIGKIRVHPQNPDIVYVAAFGHAFGANAERGVYKSTDGGETWRLTLYKSDKAGAVDLTLDETNPRILYAAIWEAYRSPWMISSGGPDSGLWRSTDGGETWSDISDNKGLPKGIKGKIGVAASPARPGCIWALVQHKEAGGLYRSDDYGDTWQQVNDDFRLISRAWYYMHLTADPQDGDTVYVNNLQFWKSTDGGKTFSDIDTPHGDNHDLWIDPKNPQRMIQGNDGGANVSYNGAASWSTIYNQPTAQFYHVAADTREPYYVYGTQQDNTSIAVPSRGAFGAIPWGDCYIAGTGESGYIAVRPDDPNIVYVGAIGSSPGGGNSLQRYDHRTRQIRLITTWPREMRGYGASEEKYRFHWTYPIIISPHDPNTLYIGGNIVFKSTNEGQSWQPISLDLSRADPNTLQPTGGPVNLDAIGAETYALVFALAESSHAPGVLWAGTDDGLVHITRDGGAWWSNITPPDLPEWSTISGLELSPHDPATAYIAAYRYKLDDYRPYVYKTNDYGQTWQSITNGLPDDDFPRVIREDPTRRGLLYLGTETGLYVSFDDGANWQRFQMNLPVAPVHDLLIKNNDLIAATHGRAFWILDDLTALRQAAGAASQGVQLLKPGVALRLSPGIDWSSMIVGAKNYLGAVGAAYTVVKTPEGAVRRRFIDAGDNPPVGVVVGYHLDAAPEAPLTLTFKDSQGNVIREVRSLDEKERAEGKTKELRAPAESGWNRFVWDMTVTPLTKIVGDDLAAQATIPGPVVAPGTYSVTLTVSDFSATQPIEIVKEPNVTSSQEDLQAQFDLQMRIYHKLNETVAALNQMRDLRAQLGAWKDRAAGLPNGEAIASNAGALSDKALDVEKKLLWPDIKAPWKINDHGSRLLNQLMELPFAVGLGDYRPTDAAYQVFDELSGEIDAVLAEFAALKEQDLAALNRLIAESQVSAITPKAASAA